LSQELLSVAICTRNRAVSLRRSLASLVDCAQPSDAPWEVLIVDNGSTDDTRSTIAEFEGLLPLRVVLEPVRGLSHARNAAVRAARGRYMLWTDDDCVVERQWLVAYAAAFRQWPDAALFGGPIVPRFDGDPPRWLARIADRVGTAYAARDLGPEPVALSVEENRVPFGANYAVRASEQRRRSYDLRFGRGTEFPMSVGEEGAVLKGLLRDGARGRWVPGAVVTHCIPPDRQRISYLRAYYAADGAADEWLGRANAGDDRSRGRPSGAELFVRTLRSELRYQILRRLAGPEAWIDALILASDARGRARARRALKAVP
jgi:glycosyltransferase involved in cell wall biosynthesis